MVSNMNISGDPITVLLVEDNPGHAELIIRSLRNHRVANTITHISDGAAALDYLHRRGEYSDPVENPTPGLILLDLRLPKIDGLEVLRQVKTYEKLKAIPVVILTTSDAESDMARAYEYNANSYLVKPVDFQRIGELMQHLGFYWLAWNRLP